MRNSSRTLAKVFTPVLLLTAMVVLPGSAKAANPNEFALDGYLSDSGGRCMVLRLHDGGTRMITGNIDGLQSGDHVRLFGHLVNNACGYRTQAYEVDEVHTLWADDQHRSTYYDHLTDGSFDDYAYGQSRSGRYSDRGRYDNRYDDRYDRDDRYGRYDRDSRYDRSDGQIVSLRGRLRESRNGCRALQADNGRIYYLEGDLRGFRNGSSAQVIGWAGIESRCGGPAIDVREINR